MKNAQQNRDPKSNNKNATSNVLDKKIEKVNRALRGDIDGNLFFTA